MAMTKTMMAVSDVYVDDDNRMMLMMMIRYKEKSLVRWVGSCDNKRT